MLKDNEKQTEAGKLFHIVNFLLDPGEGSVD